jgi:hypothetical protein
VAEGVLDTDTVMQLEGVKVWVGEVLLQPVGLRVADTVLHPDPVTLAHLEVDPEAVIEWEALGEGLVVPLVHPVEDPVVVKLRVGVRVMLEEAHTVGERLGVRVWVVVTEGERELDREEDPEKVLDPEKVGDAQGVAERQPPMVPVGLRERLSVGDCEGVEQAEMEADGQELEVVEPLRVEVTTPLTLEEELPDLVMELVTE